MHGTAETLRVPAVPIQRPGEVGASRIWMDPWSGGVAHTKRLSQTIQTAAPSPQKTNYALTRDARRRSNDNQPFNHTC